MVLSNYLAVHSLKGMVPGGGRGGLNMRRALIVFQFSISLLFIVGAIVISKQISYIRNANKGFNTDRVMTLSDWGLEPSQLETYTKSIRAFAGGGERHNGGHAADGFCAEYGYVLGDAGFNGLRGVSAHMGNEDYIPFYGMKLVAGRNIFHSDSLRELVINETYARQLGCKTPQEAIGQDTLWRE